MGGIGSGRRPTHGGKGTSEYKAWTAMRYRCQNPKDRAYKWYGARGIKVCERWEKFENFLADMGKRPPGLSLERVDNNKGYEPSNCIWATWTQQMRNRRSWSWKTQIGLVGR